MKKEIRIAVNFLTEFLRTKHYRATDEQLRLLSSKLADLVCNYFVNHWYPDKPSKGNGYRCIRINHIVDPVILNAIKECSLSNNNLCQCFPKELAVWIDPGQVSYRIGDDGSICILYDESKAEEEMEIATNNDGLSTTHRVTKQWTKRGSHASSYKGISLYYRYYECIFWLPNIYFVANNCIKRLKR